jgi:hypothetical protein
MTLDTDHLGEGPGGQKAQVDPSVTPELFLEWRSPRFGTSNPELMTNPVWAWLVNSRLNAYQANQHFRGPEATDAGPGWCCDRFGQSATQLPDGRVVLIAGEHEDHYDPDFFIYNDVVVKHPDGRLDIYGYPRDIFPPTDFHSATLAGHRIVLIGSLGYPKDRRAKTTPVFTLDLETFRVAPVETGGPSPGWIHGHDARLSEDGASILIRRGLLDRGEPGGSLVENIDDWRLNLADWRWERLTERRWQRWEVRRKDGKPNHLFEIQQALWARDHPEFGQLGGPAIDEKLGGPPNLDIYSRLYQPGVAHTPLEQPDDEYNVHRINVHGVIVRYVESMHGIQVTVEGELPQAKIEALTADLLEKMSVLERSRCELRQL